MPAQLPGATVAQNAANPSQGRWVIFDPLSGPKGSPFDKGAGTGALSTGIGIGTPPVIDIGNGLFTPPQEISLAGFDDNQTPGTTTPGAGTQNAVNSTFMYVGGGRSNAPTIATDGRAVANPYTAGISICGAGNGGSRDGGTGPAFSGFAMRMVTATGTTANGAAVEAGWSNRAGVAISNGQSVFGSAATPLGAAS
jgi:hypothetical protein